MEGVFFIYLVVSNKKFSIVISYYLLESCVFDDFSKHSRTNIYMYKSR